MQRKSLLIIAAISVTILTVFALISTFVNPTAQAQDSNSKITTPVHITTVSASKNQSLYIDFVGTVKAINQIKVLPATSGQIISSQVKDGDTVKQGDILFTISGIDNTKHSLQSQYELAQTNFTNAQKAIEAVKESNSAALQAAEIQVKTAQHQAQAISQDLEVYNRNIGAAKSTLTILQDNLSNTSDSNQQNLNKADITIQSSIDSINMLNAQRTNTFNNLFNQLNDTTDSKARDTLQNQINSTGMDFDQKLLTLNNQLQVAQVALRSSQSSSQLANNQVHSQMIQSQAQQDILNLNQSSTALKAGYDGTNTDAISIAKIGTTATIAKNKANLIQAQSQLDLAKTNLETAKNQLEYLTIHSPIDGIVSQISVQPGDIINTQSIVTQIVNPQGFELNVGVNADDVTKIDKTSVQIGEKFLEVSIKNISPIADPNSKLVNVTLELPNIFFRTNQTISTRISFKQPSTANNQNQAYMIPLDALVIDDTNAKYLFIDKNGLAQKTPVTVGDINGNTVAILYGIQDNDQIIVQGSQDLTDGQAIILN